MFRLHMPTGLWLICAFLTCSTADAAIVRIFDAKSLLEDSDLVCYGKVTSVKAYDRQAAGVTQKGLLATIEVISLVKGQAPSPLQVFFVDGREDMSCGTMLEEKESALLFLKSVDGMYCFSDSNNGKLVVPEHKALPYRSETPEGRLVEELLFVATFNTELSALKCMAELGRFPTPEVIDQLKKLAGHADMAVQGTAYLALVRLDEPPDAAHLADFIKRTDKTNSLERFRTTEYGNATLKVKILTEMAGQFNVICRDYDDQFTSAGNVARRNSARGAAAKWKGFDLILFLSAVLKVDAKQALFEIESWGGKNDASKVAFRSMAEMLADQLDHEGRPAKTLASRSGSRALVAQLLQMDDAEVSFAAARALDRMVGSASRFKYPQTREAFDTYVASCRDWLAAHPTWVQDDK